MPEQPILQQQSPVQTESNDSRLLFTYNDEGIRISKAIGSTKHIYRLDGSRIIVEEVGLQTYIYLYDADGSPIGMQYVVGNSNFETYWFEKNLQGDIVAVYDAEGTKLISYKYDAWGNFNTYYHNGCTASSVAAKNPFRYRGYYYDSELGMYYLQSRYYDPVIGRFVSADEYVSTGCGILGNNMYAYCNNNPVNYIDVNGYFPWHIVIGALVGGVSSGVATWLTGGSAQDILIDFLKGAAVGGIVAFAPGTAIPLTVYSLGSHFIDNLYDGLSWSESLWSTGLQTLGTLEFPSSDNDLIDLIFDVSFSPAKETLLAHFTEEYQATRRKKVDPEKVSSAIISVLSFGAGGGGLFLRMTYSFDSWKDVYG